MRLWRVYACEDCGAATERWRDQHESRVCVDCGLDRAVAAAVQMRTKQGPYYERFILAQQTRVYPRKSTTVE